MRLTWRPERLHYAWMVLAVVMLVQAIGSAVRFSFGVLIDPLIEEYGWSRGAISLAYSLQFFFRGHLRGKCAWLLFMLVVSSSGQRFWDITVISLLWYYWY